MNQAIIDEAEKNLEREDLKTILRTVAESIEPDADVMDPFVKRLSDAQKELAVAELGLMARHDVPVPVALSTAEVVLSEAIKDYESSAGLVQLVCAGFSESK